MQNYSITYVYFISPVAAMGGLMFGFDLGIITGVVPYIEHQFSLSGFHLGFVVAVFELGAMAGALGIAYLAKKYGRKRSMIFCAILLCFTSVGVALRVLFGKAFLPICFHPRTGGLGAHFRNVSRRDPGQGHRPLLICMMDGYLSGDPGFTLPFRYRCRIQFCAVRLPEYSWLPLLSEIPARDQGQNPGADERAVGT